MKGRALLLPSRTWCQGEGRCCPDSVAWEKGRIGWGSWTHPECTEFWARRFKWREGRNASLFFVGSWTESCSMSEQAGLGSSMARRQAPPPARAAVALAGVVAALPDYREKPEAGTS